MREERDAEKGLQGKIGILDSGNGFT